MEVPLWVAAVLNGTRPVSHAVIPQELHAPTQSLSRGLIVMVQVSAQQDEVNLCKTQTGEKNERKAHAIMSRDSLRNSLHSHYFLSLSLSVVNRL